MKDKIIEIIKNACALDEKVTEDSVIKELSLDSLTFVGVLVKIEKLFDIEFDIEELDGKIWNTVGEFINFTEKKYLNIGEKR